MSGIDSDALRAKRHRRHKAGDHSLCDADRYRAARDEQDVRDVTPPNGMTTSAAVAALLSAVPFDEGDPRAVMCAVAVRLAAAFDQKSSPGLARELRYTISSITESPASAPDLIDELKARRLGRRVDGIIPHHLRADG